MVNKIESYLREVHTAFSKWGWRGFPFLFSRIYYRNFSEDIKGVSVWDKDWDLLVILDTCRPSWLADVQDSYPYIQSVESVYSVASHSKEFIEKTFENHPKQLSDTIYEGTVERGFRTANYAK
jgi:hypothetical protein